MRAIFTEDKILNVGQKILIEGERAHHLINVIRIKIKDRVLLLNGAGLRAEALIETINRKEVFVQISAVTKAKKEELFDVGLALLKRDAMVDNLKVCAELGVSRIYPLETEFSKRDFIKEGRIDRIFESACIQANAFYLPELQPVQALSENLLHGYDHVFVFSSSDVIETKYSDGVVEGKKLLLIGPEGGFSTAELEMLKGFENCSIIHFPTNILRATTALPVACGWFLGKIYKGVKSH